MTPHPNAQSSDFSPTSSPLEQPTSARAVGLLFGLEASRNSATSRARQRKRRRGTEPPVEITSSGDVPFPHLETLAVRDFGPTRSCGLDDAVLGQFGETQGAGFNTIVDSILKVL